MCINSTSDGTTDVRFSKIKQDDLPDMSPSLRDLIFIMCCQLRAFDIVDCASKDITRKFEI